ncbi:MAG: GNAT family N-acetyltransferase [Sphingomicrobium sp.]
MTDPLDRPIWHALTGRQAGFAVGAGVARRFDPAVSPFIACADDGDAALADAAALVGRGESALFLQAGTPPVPPGLVEVERGVGVQMVGDGFVASDAPGGLVRLGAGDAAQMVALAALTKPGPFLPRTCELSQFWGVRGTDGRLLAMAGERLKLPGMSEISGVCTHPDARGKGFARMLSAHVGSEIVRRGEVPFLSAYAWNAPAIRLYEELGFVVRGEIGALMVGRP